MSDALRFIPPRVQLTDDRGYISREWYLFFQGVFERIGGPNGTSTEDLSASLFEDAGNSETVALLGAVNDALSQQPMQVLAQQVQDLVTEFNQLSATLDSISKTINDVAQQPVADNVVPLIIDSLNRLRSGTTLGNGAAAAAGTLANAPVAGNPTKWIPIDDNGIIRYIPAW